MTHRPVDRARARRFVRQFAAASLAASLGAVAVLGRYSADAPSAIARMVRPAAARAPRLASMGARHLAKAVVVPRDSLEARDPRRVYGFSE